MGNGTKLIGSGSATPKTVVSNDDLSKIVDTNDGIDWENSSSLFMEKKSNDNNNHH